MGCMCGLIIKYTFLFPSKKNISRSLNQLVNKDISFLLKK